MDKPSDATGPPLSLSAARQVLVAMQAEDVEAPHASFPQIDGYIIERELGRGAGGITYLAHKHGSQAKIALKVLHIPLGEGRASQRAWRELDVLQQVRCPSVPRLLDFGTTDHSLYIATEYVEGSPLNEVYEHARPPDLDEMRERVSLLVKIARAAHSLHERGVIHRDLKPSNVIVTPNREPFIIDLGIALIDATDLHQTLTQDGNPVGTPAFMAPEQARGERQEISTRSDIYSLGAIGYWLCTGETPHDLTGVTLHEAIRRVGSEPAREARGISKAVPKALGAVLRKACGPRPGDRYPSARSLAEDLHKWIERSPVSATPPSLWQRGTAWLGHHPIATTAIMCGALVSMSTVCSFAVVWWLNSVPDRVEVIPIQDSLSVARLLSRSGNILWERSFERSPEGINARYFARRNSLLLGVGDIHDGCEDVLVKYECADMREPRARMPGMILIPQPLRYALDSPSTAAGRFNTVTLQVADVFASVPGDEIIAIHTNSPNSPTVVRVYDMDLKVLFSFWHDGHLLDIYWLGSSGQLVFCGMNSDGKWHDRARPTSFRAPYPAVVFAVTPVFGNIDRILAWPGFQGDLEPDWYYCVDSADTGECSMHDLALSEPTAVIGTNSAVQFEFTIDGTPFATRAWVINADGNEVSTSTSSTWSANPLAPDADSIRLAPLPPRRTPREK